MKRSSRAQSGRFVTSWNNRPFYTGAELKTNIFHQWSTHQEAIVLLTSGRVDAPLCSPDGSPVHKRSSAWPDARALPAVSRRSPSVHRANPRRSRYNEGFRQRGEPGRLTGRSGMKAGKPIMKGRFGGVLCSPIGRLVRSHDPQRARMTRRPGERAID